MSSGDNNLAKALELFARAEAENDPVIRAELENLASAFLRLAEQAERNTAFVVEFEHPTEKDSNPKPKL
jgi:nucleoid-associated protein YgaU